MKNPPTDLTRLVRQVGILTAIPMVLVCGPLLGFLFGRFFDRRFGSDPWGMTASVVAGLIAGIVESVMLIRYAQGILDGSRRSRP